MTLKVKIVREFLSSGDLWCFGLTSVPCACKLWLVRQFWSVGPMTLRDFMEILSYTSAFDPLLSNFEKKNRLRSCRFQVSDRHQTHPLPFPAIAVALVSGFFIRGLLFCCTCGAHVYMINHQSSRDTSVPAGVLRQRPGRWRALQSDGAHMLRNFQSVFIRLTLYAGPSYKRRKQGTSSKYC